MLKAEALNKWIEALWNNPENKIENYLDEKEAIHIRHFASFYYPEDNIQMEPGPERSEAF